MPSPFSDALRIQENERLYGRKAQERQALLQERMTAQQEAAARSLMARQYLMSISPAAGRLQVQQRKYADQQEQAKAWVDYMKGIPISQIPPEWRGHYQTLLNDPNANPSIAEWIVKAAKPRGVQLKATDTVDAEGDPVRSYDVWDPMDSGSSVSSSSSPRAAAGRPLAAAAPDGFSPTERGLIDKYGGL